MDGEAIQRLWTTRSVADAAAAGGRPVTQEYVRQLCKQGAIPASKPARDWFISEEAARAWVRQWLDGDGRTGDKDE